MSEIINIKNESLSVSISTFGAEIKSVKSTKGTEFMWQGDKNSWDETAPVLFPICGILKDNTLIYKGKPYNLVKHGFAKLMEFKAEKLAENKAAFSLSSTEETLKMFPFDFVLTVTYELKENNVIVSWTVKNPSNEEMYFSIGGHEGYHCPEGYEAYSVEFEKPVTLLSHTVTDSFFDGGTEVIAENVTSLPLKRELFEVSAPVFKYVDFDKISLVHNKGGRKITLSFPGIDHLLIWALPDADFVCLEPWAGLPDGFDSNQIFAEKDGIIKLDGNSEKVISHVLTFED